jgi:hypothetical protein
LQSPLHACASAVPRRTPAPSPAPASLPTQPVASDAPPWTPRSCHAARSWRKEFYWLALCGAYAHVCVRSAARVTGAAPSRRRRDPVPRARRG